MRRRRSSQFAEILSAHGYGRVCEKYPEDAKVEDEMERLAPSKQSASRFLDRGRNTRDGDRSQ